MPDPERVFLALFAYAGVTAETLDCVLRDLPSLPNAVYHRQSRDALISRSRSAAASQFVRSQADGMLMIDHDISWKPGDLLRLARKTAETQSIAASVDSKRCFGGGMAVRFFQSGDHTLDTDWLIEAEYVSTGVCGCHRRVVDAIARKLPLTHDDFWPFFLPMLSKPEKNEASPLSDEEKALE